MNIFFYTLFERTTKYQGEKRNRPVAFQGEIMGGNCPLEAISKNNKIQKSI